MPRLTKAQKAAADMAAREATKNPAAVSLGTLGGKKTAKKGAEYFRKIAALRKTHKGGRPPKGAM